MTNYQPFYFFYNAHFVFRRIPKIYLHPHLVESNARLNKLETYFCAKLNNYETCIFFSSLIYYS